MSININDLSRLFENNPDKNNQPVSFEVVVVGEIREDNGERKALLLRDHRDYTVEFPYEMYLINSLSISLLNTLHLSKEMYEVWFQRAYHQEYKHLSDIAYKHFGRLLENSDLILRNEKYANLRLPFLRAGMMYVGSRSYSLGALLKSWIETDTFLLANGAYMMSITGSSLSGTAYYKAWCPKKKEIIYNGLSSPVKNGMSYFKNFEALGKEFPERNISDLKVLGDMLTILKIKTNAYL